MVNVLQQLQQALEPTHPSLVLCIEPESAEVDAVVYQGDEPFDVTHTFRLTPSAARAYLGIATRLVIDSDEAEVDRFNMQLDELDAGRLLKATQFVAPRRFVTVAYHPEAGVLGVWDGEPDLDAHIENVEIEQVELQKGKA